MPLKNYLILSGRLMGSFRHLELQNPSIISDFRHIDRILSRFCKFVMEEEQEEQEEQEEHEM